LFSIVFLGGSKSVKAEKDVGKRASEQPGVHRILPQAMLASLDVAVTGCGSFLLAGR
jgi:hypothetical protein